MKQIRSKMTIKFTKSTLEDLSAPRSNFFRVQPNEQNWKLYMIFIPKSPLILHRTFQPMSCMFPCETSDLFSFHNNPPHRG